MWKPVSGFPKYEVSPDGGIRSPRGPLRHIIDGNGYPIVTLYAPEVKRNILVHRAVATAFVPNPDGHEWVLHRDGDSRNPAASNLYWGTPAQNSADMVAHGRAGRANGGKTHCIRGHAFDRVNTYTTGDGRRDCRTCIRMRLAKSKARAR